MAITNGTDFNYFSKITVTNTSFAAASDVLIGFRGAQSFTLSNESATIKIEYSFNGNTLHGDLTPGTPSAAIAFDDRRVSRIWFRVPSGSAVVRVEAWAKV